MTRPIKASILRIPDLSKLMVEKHYDSDERIADALDDILRTSPLDKTSPDYKVENDD